MLTPNANSTINIFELPLWISFDLLTQNILYVLKTSQNSKSSHLNN
eukprot:UN04998